jgi:AMP-polyphosphate phosphotransferase
MFETVEIGHSVDKETYNRKVPELRTALLSAQRELASSPVSVVVIVGGVEGAGKSETVNLLLEWMDARGIETHAMWEATEEEQQRPPLWRFWRVLPARGRLAILFGSWYTLPIIDRVFKRINRAEFEKDLDRIVQFEEMLHQENTMVVKFWMHLSKEAQKKRLKVLRKDPKQRWRVTRMDRRFVKRVDRFREISERALHRTDLAQAPWHLVEATDARYRNLTVAQTLLDSLQEAVERTKASSQTPAIKPRIEVRPAGGDILRKLDLRVTLGRSEYDDELVQLQEKLSFLARRLHEERRSMMLVFEGPDAAGKGGAIRRITASMDARNYQVMCVGAPTDEERAHPYLWRFWRHLPPPGRVTIYDRSWYGRVLVERIEGFCAPAEWHRAYSEINAFEEQLGDFGILLIKFWLSISPEEQLRRFQNRQTTPYKQYKLTEEDWRNRDKWEAYQTAACEMIEKTSSTQTPWILVEADNKEWARIKVLKAVIDRLERELGS